MFLFSFVDGTKIIQKNLTSRFLALFLFLAGEFWVKNTIFYIGKISGVPQVETLPI